MPKKKEVYYNTAAAPLALEALGFDPLQECVKIAKGEAHGEEHPFFEVLEKELTAWAGFIRNGKGVSADHVEKFIDVAKSYLDNTWVSPEIRFKYLKELLAKTHGNKNQLEHVESAEDAGEVKPLTQAEIKKFKPIFESFQGKTP